MSKNLPAVINFAPLQELPADAPPMKIDPYNPHLSFEDVLPENYISMESLQNWCDSRNADARILTVTAVSIELLFDPSKGEKAADGEYKPVLWFAETESGLVINKSRGQMLTKLAGSPMLARWGKVGQVALKVGIANGKGQVIIQALPESDEPEVKQTRRGSGNGRNKPPVDMDGMNDDLFG